MITKEPLSQKCLSIIFKIGLLLSPRPTAGGPGALRPNGAAGLAPNGRPLQTLPCPNRGQGNVGEACAAARRTPTKPRSGLRSCNGLLGAVSSPAMENQEDREVSRKYWVLFLYFLKIFSPTLYFIRITMSRGTKLRLTAASLGRWAEHRRGPMWPSGMSECEWSECPRRARSGPTSLGWLLGAVKNATPEGRFFRRSLPGTSLWSH